MAIFLLLPLLLSLPQTLTLTQSNPLDRQEQLLLRLESLLDSLSQNIALLQSSLSLPPQSPPPSNPPSPFLHHFQLLSSPLLPSPPSSASFLPNLNPKHLAIADTSGRLHILNSSGHILLNLPTHFTSSVTCLFPYLSSRRNETIILTGHADGSISAYQVADSRTLTLASSRAFALGSTDPNSPPVVVLDAHQVGRIRYVLAADTGGRIRVFTESGTLYGTAISSSRVLAFMRQKLIFLTEAGAGSLDLRSMSVKEVECDGMNGSVASSDVFDGLEKGKAYGFTSSGDLIHVVIVGEGSNLKCRVRAIRKGEIGIDGLVMIRGYLVAVGREKVAVYNVSSQYYGRVGPPRPLFTVDLKEIGSDGFVMENPLVASDGEKLVVLGIGGGCVGIYRSKFPVFRAESNAVVWSAPVFLFVLFLIGSWQFYVKKKDSLGWVGEEGFDVNALGLNERGFGDGQRATDLRGLRGPTRSYVSSQRFAGGAGGSFRPSSAELSYRGQSGEAAGFSNRREGLFQNAQVVDEHVD